MERSSGPFSTGNVGGKEHVIRFHPIRFVGDTPPIAIPSMQILLVLHGSAVLKRVEGVEELSSGNLVVIRPGIAHSLVECQALQTIRCTLSPSVFRSRVGAALDSRALCVLLDASPVKRYHLPTDKFRSVAGILGGAGAGGDMGNIGRMLLLLEAIVEHSQTPVAKLHPAVFSAIQKFDEEVAHDWSLPEISAQLELDPSYVARLFTSVLGAPPLAYLALLRSEEAARKLVRDKCSCAEIGASVGWNDPNYFSRRFRQILGLSPTEFRELNASTDPSAI